MPEKRLAKTRDKQVKVLIAYPTAENARFYEFYDSIDRLIVPSGTSKIPVHSSYSARNRNKIIRAFLDEDYTHLFLMDDDQVFKSDTLMKLLARDVDIVSGMYCLKAPPFPILAFDVPRSDGKSAFITDLKYGELREVARVGAGCLLLKREVLERITPPWFAIGTIEPDESGQDFYFCDKARAAGYKIYLDTTVSVGHMTKVMLVPEWNGSEWEIKFSINEGMRIK